MRLGLGRCRHWPGPRLNESVGPTGAPKGHMLPRATAIDDKKNQEVGPFRPHFYNAWMAIHERIQQGVDLVDPFGSNKY